MYAALWRRLPGPAWLRAVEMTVLLLVTLVVLFEFVFPWVASLMPLEDQVVDP